MSISDMGGRKERTNPETGGRDGNSDLTAAN